MKAERAEWADCGRDIGPPPWILGHRGVPREAPENTLSSLRRAVDLGLDGFEYDLHACASGEAVLLHDETLDRTTDASGLLITRTLPELFGIDAGSWFDRRFRGEPLPLFDEALEVAGDPDREPPMHLIELKEHGLVSIVAERLREVGSRLPVRVISFLREVVLEARDQGMPAMLLADHASEVDRRFVREERVQAYGVGPGGWRNEAGRADWSFCERWGWSVDLPEDLLEACREPLFGFNTNEPYRALATRALASLTPGDGSPHPLRVPILEVVPESLDAATRARGEWFGAWELTARVRNPFGFEVDVACDVHLQGGAFEPDGLPVAARLDPGEEVRVPFRLLGGSRSPGSDPLFFAHYRWRAGPGRASGRLLLDAPLARTRRAAASTSTERLVLLAERADDSLATILMRRRGGHLLLSIERAGALSNPHIVARLGGEIARGGKGLRLRLPEDFDMRVEGVPFSCGIEGILADRPALRRWAGGIPEGIFAGAPGRLFAVSRA
jgi:glycerophosphoryl diester phosphodiesterase